MKLRCPCCGEELFGEFCKQDDLDQIKRARLSDARREKQLLEEIEQLKKELKEERKMHSETLDRLGV